MVYALAFAHLRGRVLLSLHEANVWEGGRGLFWSGSAKTDSNLFYYQPQTSKQPLNQPQAQTGIGVARRHCLSAGDVMC